MKAKICIRPISFLSVLLLCCLQLAACGASKEIKPHAANSPAKFFTATLGQLKLRLPVSMAQTSTVLPAGFKNLVIRSQNGNHSEIYIGTLDNFQDSMTTYIAKGILSDSIKTFDGFFGELVNVVGTQNYPKLQKVMEVQSAASAKQYPRNNPSVYQFNFAKEKHMYIVFDNPKYVAEIYYLKGAISDADADAITSGLKD